MTDPELDRLDADLKRRAESLWSELVGDSELFVHLRGVLAELRADARRGSGLEPDAGYPYRKPRMLTAGPSPARIASQRNSAGYEPR